MKFEIQSFGYDIERFDRFESLRRACSHFRYRLGNGAWLIAQWRFWWDCRLSTKQVQSNPSASSGSQSDSPVPRKQEVFREGRKRRRGSIRKVFFFSFLFFLGGGGAEVWGWINDEYRSRGSAQSAAGNFAGVGSQEIWCRSRSLRTFEKTRAAHSSTASHVFFQYDCEQYFYSYIK